MAALSYIIITIVFVAVWNRVSTMSASTESLVSAVAALTVEVAAVATALEALKAAPKVDPADTAAVDKAVADIQAATDALRSAVA